jgi:hypothetical protein
MAGVSGGPREFMARSGNRTKGAKGSDASARLVQRYCRVCEWKDQLVESASDSDPDCPWCHGPTAVEPGTAVDAAADASGGKNPHAAALGRLGGIKGGTARAQSLSAKRRREIASKAARARWNKR